MSTKARERVDFGLSFLWFLHIIRLLIRVRQFKRNHSEMKQHGSWNGIKWMIPSKFGNLSRTATAAYP
jgi:hypothetical protein